MPAYFRYDNAILGSQTTVGGVPHDYNYVPASGSTWSWTGSQTSFLVTEVDPLATNFNGDEVNEQVDSTDQIGNSGEQVVTIGGIDRQVVYDFTFEITAPDGTVYSVALIDVDLNNDNDLQDANEDGYYLVFPDGVPPAGVN